MMVGETENVSHRRRCRARSLGAIVSFSSASYTCKKAKLEAELFLLKVKP